MLGFLNKALSADRIAAAKQAVEAIGTDTAAAAFRDALKPLLRAQRHQREAAEALLELAVDGALPIDVAAEVFGALLGKWCEDRDFLVRLGQASQRVRDIDDLNLAAPEDGLLPQMLERLLAMAGGSVQQSDDVELLEAIASVTRMMARHADELAEASARRAVELEPEKSNRHYNFGLWCKTRGRFAEGQAANRKAMELAAEPPESYKWNLGICATGNGDGETALQVWKSIGQKIDMGRFDLPEGGYPSCKIRLAERPLAERSQAQDDPGLEETIWIERLSPCHGVIRSVLYEDLGVDYGDVVLFDGAPITYHRYDDRDVPVFPHLATLRSNRYRFYDFAGTQSDAGQLEALTVDLPEDAVLYSHTENLRTLCASCWRDPDVNHSEHEPREEHIVTGRIAAPTGVSPSELLSALDELLRDSGCQVLCPSLCEAAGDTERGDVEKRRYNMLVPA